jgi:hypothetical protein
MKHEGEACARSLVGFPRRRELSMRALSMDAACGPRCLSTLPSLLSQYDRDSKAILIRSCLSSMWPATLNTLTHATSLAPSDALCLHDTKASSTVLDTSKEPMFGRTGLVVRPVASSKRLIIGTKKPTDIATRS